MFSYYIVHILIRTFDKNFLVDQMCKKKKKKNCTFFFSEKNQ